MKVVVLFIALAFLGCEKSDYCWKCKTVIMTPVDTISYVYMMCDMKGQDIKLYERENTIIKREEEVKTDCEFAY